MSKHKILPFLLASGMFGHDIPFAPSGYKYVKRNGLTAKAWKKRKRRLKMAKLSRRINRGL